MALQFQHRSHRVYTDFSQTDTAVDALTYSVWHKGAGNPLSIHRFLHGTGGSGTTFLGIGTSLGIQFSATFNNGGTPTVYTWTVDDTTLPVNGTAYHIAVVFNGTDNKNGAVIYLDGVPQQVSTTVTEAGLSYYRPTGNWGLLNAVAGGGGASGHYADLRLYDYPMSPEEIVTIYTTRGKDALHNRLLVRAYFNEKNASEVAVTGNCKDYSENEHALTLQVVSSTILFSNELSYVQPVRRRS